MKLVSRFATGLAALGWIPTLIITSQSSQDFRPIAQERTPIKVTRIYTGPDNQTHAEEYEIPLGLPRGATELSEPVDVTSLQFRRTSPNYFIDWHTAPRRQYVITLKGESEVEIGDGTKVRLHPGHILLAEDLTGQGHISRALGSEDRISLFIPLAGQ
mgnify:FL=1|tara:strand:- start:26573 stop:27046 length:474 start_codon:yes stop_codon:yes gene_type:complete